MALCCRKPQPSKGTTLFLGWRSPFHSVDTFHAILVTGASGSGTTTLGATIAQAIGAELFNADDYFWVPSDPPYKEKCSPEDRLAMLLKAIESCAQSVIAGSVMGWGAALENSFSLIVFLQVPTSIRLERIQHREMARFGKVNPDFLEWASQYDEGPPEGRSLVKHNDWLTALRCPVIRLIGNLSQSEQLEVIATEVSKTKVDRGSPQAALVDSIRALRSGHRLPRILDDK